MDPQKLLQRLDAIAQSFSQTTGALALLALGSSGVDRDRLDQYSDLDFFAVVSPGYKKRFVDNVAWLESVHSVGYRFKNTENGYKLLYADGIFCEMAVFEVDELTRIPKPAARVIWAVASFDPQLARPIGEPSKNREASFLLGEALTNLYVGLGRYLRGEKLSAMRFVQGFALDRVLELAQLVLAEQPISQDLFMNDRRIEARLPDLASQLPRMAQGYEKTPDSAAEILRFLEKHFPVNEVIAREIRTLLKEAES
ncbi:MAG: hypothetical protein QNJ45_07825 [Ardenticatenaceae bacterium]|nr:hypothetical protein [Ardenticatenaceae bacterium]